MRYCALSVTLALAWPAAARADDEFKQLQKDYSKAVATWSKSAREGERLDFKEHPAIEFYDKMREYAREHAGEEEAVPALVWMLQNGRMAMMSDTAALKKETQRILDRLLKDYAKDAAIAPALPALRYASYQAGTKKVTGFYETVMKQNPDREVKASATFHLAAVLSDGAARSDDEDQNKRAMKLFRKVAKEYSDTDYAERAGAYIFQLDNLQIGKKAPEIVGEDVEGEEIRLSQFKGQVVVLDFWGFW